MKPQTPVAILAGLLLMGLWLLPRDPSSAAATPGSMSEVVLHTTSGDITIALHPEWAPTAVAVFTRNCRQGALDDTILHVAWDEVVGGGKYESNGSVRTSAVVSPQREAESAVERARGRVAFRPFAAGSGLADSGEFIIALGNNSSSTPFTVFGEVIAGLDIIDALAEAELESDEIPLNPTVVESTTLQAP